MTTVTAADDQRHTPDSDASNWSESWVFYFIDPRHQICCITRIGLAPNKDSCNVGVAMSRAGKPLYQRQFDGLPLPTGDMLSGISAGGLTIRALSLEEQRFHVSFDDPTARLSFAFDWHGLHEPADSIGLHVPGGVAGLSNMHIEQMGRISGSMQYREERLDLAGMGPRDHSVGTRHWESMLWYDLAWVLMDDGRAFGLIQVQQTERLVQIPWLWDGEQLLPLSGMRFDKTLDKADRPETVTITVADPLGRSYRLSGSRRTSIPCFLDSYVVHSAYFDFVLDDGTRGIGAEEYGYRMGETH